ncbi:MAG: hypothetical protein II370_06360 [Clostridia bacterium]|nr:hypothetical protein [Clostridia bacterium]
MYVYSVIMFLVAGIFGAVAIAIYRGKTELIHDYHQVKVKDKAAYGRAFGKAMLVIALSMLLSGVIALFGEAEAIVMISLTVLVLGMGIGIGCILAVQKKYNNGLF